LILSIILYRFLLEPKRGQSEIGETLPAEKVSVRDVLRAVFRTPMALLVMGAFMCANFIASMFLVWTPTFLMQKFDFKLTAAGLSGSVFIHLASAFAVPFAGMLSDLLAKQMAGGRLLTQAVGLVIGAGFIFMVGFTRDVTTLLIAMTCFGICKGFYDANIFAGLYDVIPAHARGTAAGIMNTVGWSGGALAPWLFGSFAKRGGGTEVENMSQAISFGSLFYIVAALLLIGAILFRAEKDIRR
jgi:MFS family permease